MRKISERLSQWTQNQLQEITFAPDDPWKLHPYASPAEGTAVQGHEACRVLSLGHGGTQLQSTFQAVAFGKHDGREACMVVVNLRFIYHKKELIDRALIRLNFGTADPNKAGPITSVAGDDRFVRKVDISPAKAMLPTYYKLYTELNSQDLVTSYPRGTNLFGPLEMEGEVKTEESTIQGSISSVIFLPTVSTSMTTMKTKQDRWHAQGVRDGDRPCYTWTFFGNDLDSLNSLPRSFSVGAIVEHDDDPFYCDVSVAGRRKGESDWHVNIERKKVRLESGSSVQLTAQSITSNTGSASIEPVPAKPVGLVDTAAATPAIQTSTIHVEHQTLVQNMVQHQNVAILPSGKVVESEERMIEPASSGESQLIRGDQKGWRDEI